MYDQGDTVIGKDICSQSVPVDPSLDIRPRLLCVPWCGMDEPVYGPVSPGVPPFLWKFLLEPPHPLNGPEVCLNIEAFIQVSQYPIVKGLKPD